MSDKASLAAAVVAEAVARHKLADEQSTHYQAITRRGGELADAVRAVHFHSPDTLPEYAHLCDMPPDKLADHVQRWVAKLLDAGRRISAEQLQDSLGADGGTNNPFLPVALVLYRFAAEGDRQRVSRELGDICKRLLVRDHSPLWCQFKDALGAVAERVCVAWNVRRDGLLREHCPDIRRPYIGTQQAEGESEPAPPSTSAPPNGAKEVEGMGRRAGTPNPPAAEKLLVESAPGWDRLCEPMRQILVVLKNSTEALQARGVATLTASAYQSGTLRHHFPALRKWKYIDKAKDGYVITPAGRAIVQGDHV